MKEGESEREGEGASEIVQDVCLIIEHFGRRTNYASVMGTVQPTNINLDIDIDNQCQQQDVRVAFGHVCQRFVFLFCHLFFPSFSL